MNRKLISQSALKFNANFFKHFSPKICAVVKADAYGHGAQDVAKILCDEVDYFAVSSQQEAEEILSVVPQSKIIILSKVADYNLLDKFYLAATNISDIKKAIASGKTQRCFIKLSAGMNRYGIDCQNDNLLKKVKNLIKNYDFAGFSMHFSSISNKKQSLKEYNIFISARAKLEKSFPICLGGGGAKNFPCDMLRVGIGLYGYGDDMLKKVMTLEGKVLQIRTLEKGERAGYDGSFKASKPTTLAIVSVGYADGFERVGSKNLDVKIDGKKFKMVGRTCMDACFVDVTGGDVKVGQSVTVMDDADVLAKKYKKSTYEILTSFTKFRGERKITP